MSGGLGEIPDLCFDVKGGVFNLLNGGLRLSHHGCRTLCRSFQRSTRIRPIQLPPGLGQRAKPSPGLGVDLV